MLDQALIARPREIAEQVSQLARQILCPSVEVFWFGSWVKGTARPHADMDIAIAASEAIPLQQIAALRDAIDKLPTLHEIDLIDLLTIGKIFRGEILDHGIRLSRSDETASVKLSDDSAKLLKLPKPISLAMRPFSDLNSASS